MRLLAIAIIFFALCWGYAYPHDVNGAYVQLSPEMREWFRGVHPQGHPSWGQGYPCCDIADGQDLLDADWDSQDGHYRVRVDGEWLAVPDDAIVTEPNRYGRTVVWLVYVNGAPAVKCFMPGSMT